MTTKSARTNSKKGPANKLAKAIHPFDGDVKYAVLDSILDHALYALFPFLSEDNHPQLRVEVSQYLQTHLGTELAIINGSRSEESTSPMVVRLKKEFAERVGK